MAPPSVTSALNLQYVRPLGSGALIACLGRLRDRARGTLVSGRRGIEPPKGVTLCQATCQILAAGQA